MIFDESVSLATSSDFQNQPGLVFDEGVGMESETAITGEKHMPKLENGIVVGLFGII